MLVRPESGRMRARCVDEAIAIVMVRSHVAVFRELRWQTVSDRSSIPAAEDSASDGLGLIGKGRAHLSVYKTEIAYRYNGPNALV